MMGIVPSLFFCRQGMTQIKKEQKTPRPTKNDLRGLTVRPILIYNMAAPPKGHELNYWPDTKKLFSKCQLVHFRAASAAVWIHFSFHLQAYLIFFKPAGKL